MSDFGLLCWSCTAKKNITTLDEREARIPRVSRENVVGQWAKTSDFETGSAFDGFITQRKASMVMAEIRAAIAAV